MKVLVIVAASLLVFFSALNAVNVDAMQSQQNARHALIEAI